jgi:hypothetical protein
MANLNIGSFNVKGLADEKKRKKGFNWLRGKKMNVYMLQETHFTKENENIIEAEWGFKCIFFMKDFSFSLFFVCDNFVLPPFFFYLFHQVLGSNVLRISMAYH